MKKYFLWMLLLTVQQLFGQQAIVAGEAEKEGLLQMREEEKLARDVYDSMYAKWEVNPFGNIRQSERVHMDRMKDLLVQYKIDDPVEKTNDKPGKFVNKEMHKLYQELVKSGTLSLTDGLKAGAKIEELDIADLDKRISETSNPEIISAYKFLRMGSEHHLQAFVRRLKAQGVEYKPEILDAAVFNAIINGSTEEKKCEQDQPCCGKGQGKGKAKTGGRGQCNNNN